MKSLASEIIKNLDAISSINYQPHTGQQPFHESKARFRILAAGRRFGKTQSACYESVPVSYTHLTLPTIYSV